MAFASDAARFCIALHLRRAVGGLRLGQAIGDTGPRAERAVDHTYSGQNVLATIYRHLGIAADTKLDDLAGRPRYLLDDQRVIGELI